MTTSEILYLVDELRWLEQLSVARGHSATADVFHRSAVGLLCLYTLKSGLKPAEIPPRVELDISACCGGDGAMLLPHR